MKHRPAVLKAAVLVCSIALFAGYVTARGMGWIGRADAPAEPNTPVPAAPTTEPDPPQEFFGGSKSAAVLTPDQTKPLLPSAKPLLPSSKVLVLDPLPPERSPEATPTQQPKTPQQPK